MDFVYPLEKGEPWIMSEDAPAYPPAIRRVQDVAKRNGFWAFHLPKEAGGAGILGRYEER